jgi:hypothetical protein
MIPTAVNLGFLDRRYFILSSLNERRHLKESEHSKCLFYVHSKCSLRLWLVWKTLSRNTHTAQNISWFSYATATRFRLMRTSLLLSVVTRQKTTVYSHWKTTRNLHVVSNLYVHAHCNKWMFFRSLYPYSWSRTTLIYQILIYSVAVIG